MDIKDKLKSANKNKDLISYLKRKIRELEDPRHIEDNEIILLNLIKEMGEAEPEQPFGMAILRERLNQIALNTQRDAKASWSNPIFHWTCYLSWAKLTIRHLKFKT